MLKVKLLLLMAIVAISVQPKPEPQLMRVTCYLPTGNPTASGVYPEEGMCASNWQHMGQIAVLYDMNMEYIGEFEVTDTGGARSLRNGTSIDIFRNDMDGAKTWIKTYGDYCYVEWKEKE